MPAWSPPSTTDSIGTPISRSAALSRSNAARRVDSLSGYWPVQLAGDLDERQRPRRLEEQGEEVGQALDAVGGGHGQARGGDDVAHHGDHLVAGRPGRQHAGDTRFEQLGDVGVGHDAADDDGDVGAPLAHLLDDERGERHVRTGQHRQADGVDVLVDRRRGDGLGRLEQAGVDHLEPGVTQDPGDHLDAAVVAVEADLGDEHAPLFHRRPHALA